MAVFPNIISYDLRSASNSFFTSYANQARHLDGKGYFHKKIEKKIVA
jgi:hypothetical protein